MIHIILIVGLFWHVDVIENYDHDDGDGNDFNDADGDSVGYGETGFVYMCVCD